MTAIHSEIESIDDLEDKQVELLGGEQISAKEYLGRFGMTSYNIDYLNYNYCDCLLADIFNI